MSSPNDTDSMPREELSKKQERANRILDAASQLIQRFGYKKTTIDDIARSAGVAKGTIYLHWKTRDDLFIDLVMREKLLEVRKVEQEIAQDPEGMSLHVMMKYSTLAGLRNPLLKALMVQDNEVLGNLAHLALGREWAIQQTEAFKVFLTYLRDNGLIRSDMSLDTQIYLIQAILTGILLVDQLLPEEFQISMEAKAEAVAETTRRTFELRTPTSQEIADSSTRFHEILDVTQSYIQEENE